MIIIRYYFKEAGKTEAAAVSAPVAPAPAPAPNADFFVPTPVVEEKKEVFKAPAPEVNTYVEKPAFDPFAYIPKTEVIEEKSPEVVEKPVEETFVQPTRNEVPTNSAKASFEEYEDVFQCIRRIKK